MIYVCKYVPFKYKHNIGCAMVVDNTATDQYVVVVNADSYEIDIAKGGFTDLLSAEIWLNNYLKEHNVEFL